jgi:SAM-dependent methyltransferase
MAVRGTAWRLCYEALATRVPLPEWSFMNYGYASSGDARSPLRLAPEDEPDRLSIQLYEHAIRGTDLRGADVLEVGCGRGGGSSYLSRYHAPATTTGLDFSRAAISLCTRTRTGPGLSFVHGDALALPFPDRSFDAVVNIESSHCYDSMTTFLAEVHRVLRPGGHFLWADIRDRHRTEALGHDMAAGPLDVVEERDITAEVLRALELDSARRLSLIDAWIPWGFRRAFRWFAGVDGTRNYTRLENGEMRYLSARLVRPA